MDVRTWTLLANTLFLAGATCAASLPVGAGLGWLIARTDLPGRKAAAVLLGAMLFVPLYLQAAAWQAGFGLEGWYTLCFGARPWLAGWPAVLWIHSLAAVPWVALIVGVGLRRVDPDLEEQALLDASPWTVFRRVTLPLTRAAWIVAGLWVLILTAGEMTVTDLFAVRTYAEEVYTQSVLLAEPGQAALGILPGVAITAALVAVGIVLAARLAPRGRSLGPRRVRTQPLGRWRWPAAAIVALVLLVLIGVPLGSLVFKAGVVVTQTPTGRIREFSLAQCLELIFTGPWRFRRELGWSLLLGTTAATVSTVLGVLVGWFARRGGLRAGLPLGLTAVGLAVPGPMVGLAVIWLLNRPEIPGLTYLYDQSILAPTLALTVRALPPAVLILWHALRSVPTSTLDAAALEGAGGWTQLVRIALPSRWSAVAMAWLTAWVVSLGDLAASVLVVPPRVTTLPIRLFGLLHGGVEDRVAGMCLAQAGLIAAATALLWALARRRGGYNGGGMRG